MGIASKGQKLRLHSTELSKGWYNVENGDRDAWVWSDHVLAVAAPTTEPKHSIKIGSFNCLHLGQGKTKDIDMLAEVIANFDVCALLEVMKQFKESELLDALARASKEKTGKDIKWKIDVSELVGKTSYKERYAFVYQEGLVSEIEHGRFIDDDGNVFDRDPYYATFKAGKFDFTLMVVHITFGSLRRTEVEHLRDVYEQVRESNGSEKDVILMGDFNTPPDDKAWKPLLLTVPVAPSTLALDIHNCIQPSTKTSLSDKDFASSYDNIWIDQACTGHEYANASGTIDFVNDFFGGDQDKFKRGKELVSDHIPVWAEFNTDLDDDD